jgi:ATP-binding cassette subfamily B protein
LKDISIVIPRNKITAIVGASGSGKTTLLKMLLKFYPPTAGSISLGAQNLDTIEPEKWRTRCGVVMQDGFIFSGSIGDNISMEESSWDPEKVRQAARIACLDEFIESLPMNYHTRIGNTGSDLSGGQKQRLLIARAVYRNPDYIFFDEATSSLDATNERMIIDNLNQFFKGKTVVIIAHRLSTVKNADQIIVLENGRVTETGSHEALKRDKGRYFELVKNQLELGN